jgi:anthranilate/para-aminobenzoate synthase component I
MPLLMPSHLSQSRSLKPWELAQQHEGDGLVFLDSSLADDRAVSIVAFNPTEILTGTFPKDADRLRSVIELHEQPATIDPQKLTGGLFGWVGYDGRFAFGVYPHCAVYEHSTDSWQGLAPSAKPHPEIQIQKSALNFRPLMSREEFMRLASRAQAYISSGDIYQVNLTYPWEAIWPENLQPLSFYERLRNLSPAPYSAFMDLAGTKVFSASPESFLKMRGNQISTRPIKGTRPRGVDGPSDMGLADELTSSPKERAELVMITDLERNDLGQVCEYGSVEVTELLKLERFAQVQHLVSTVRGTLRKGVSHLEAFMACFPGGSISGAPKKRAMEIIKELEPHERGLYTGAFGYFGFNGESQFNIAIRTAWLRDGLLRFNTGSGIVADSDPGKEYEETLHKAAGILQAAQG